jgi:hypothetical protein
MATEARRRVLIFHSPCVSRAKAPGVIGGRTIALFCHRIAPVKAQNLLSSAKNLSEEVEDISAAIYSSAGNYTTAGSDIVLPPRWRLLRPFETVPPRPIPAGCH